MYPHIYVCMYVFLLQLQKQLASSFPPQKNPQRLNFFELHFEKEKKERENWILVLGGRKAQKRGREIKKGGKRHRIPETSLWFPTRCVLSAVYSHPTRGKPRLDLPTLPASLPLIANVPIILSEPGPSGRSQKEL